MKRQGFGGAIIIDDRRPFTGAWIETISFEQPIKTLGVAPSRGRGLKRLPPPNGKHQSSVAPSRGRGLKLLTLEQVIGARKSPLHGGVD